MSEGLLILGGDIVWQGKLQKNKGLLMRGGKIIRFGVSNGKNLTCLRLQDELIIPGLIDIHTHGAGGVDVSKGSIIKFAKFKASEGATACIPTLSLPVDELPQRFKEIKEELSAVEELDFPQIIGFRIEGPFLRHAGGIDKEVLSKGINQEVIDKILNASNNQIRILDISPELPGAIDVIENLSKRGIICSIAHTRATIEQTKKAVDSGARLVTHFYDTFIVSEPPLPGVYPTSLVDYLLIEDRVSVEIIPDKVHVSSILVEKAFRCKGVQRIIFVTDSNPAAGLPRGRYRLQDSTLGGEIEIFDRNSGVYRAGTKELVGSALMPIDCFRNAITLFKRSIEDASQVCSKNPADLLGLNKGELALGRDADIVILDRDSLKVRYTIVAGKVIFSRENF
ncbi:hypothetical protein DRN63_01065 [Nanoarchaeota archaeon]|nr:MAG: hypothetical protein DRN63_01065 [Nanoarchaeota archaeon]